MPSAFTFHSRIFSAVAGLALLLAIAASSAWAGTVADPTGDTLAAGPDITSVTSSLTGPGLDTLQVTVNFAGPVFGPSTFDFNSFGGWILLDTNGDANLASILPNFLQPPALGVDFYVDLFSEDFQAGQVNLHDSSFKFLQTAPISFAANSFTVSLPVAALGDATDPAIGVNAGLIRLPVLSDYALGGQSANAAVPEPGSFVLFALVAAVLFATWRRPPVAVPCLSV